MTGLLLLWLGAALVGIVVWRRARQGAFTLLEGDDPPARHPMDLLALIAGLGATVAGSLILAGVP